MNNTKKRGMFITFEGPDGSGKSTQALLLRNYLREQGYDVFHTREPGGDKIAEEIRSLLLSPGNAISPVAELFLYWASRAQHVSTLILPALQEGKIVLCERFNDATFAYQGYGRGLDYRLIKKMNALAAYKLVPDLTFLLDIPPAEGLRRARKAKGLRDRLEKESLCFHERVRKGYLALAGEEPWRIRKISVRSSVSVVQQQIVEIVEQEMVLLIEGLVSKRKRS